MTQQQFWTDSYNANYKRLISNGKSPRLADIMAERAATIATTEWVKHNH